MAATLIDHSIPNNTIASARPRPPSMLATAEETTGLPGNPYYWPEDSAPIRTVAFPRIVLAADSQPDGRNREFELFHGANMFGTPSISWLLENGFIDEGVLTEEDSAKVTAYRAARGTKGSNILVWRAVHDFNLTEEHQAAWVEQYQRRQEFFLRVRVHNLVRKKTAYLATLKKLDPYCYILDVLGGRLQVIQREVASGYYWLRRNKVVTCFQKEKNSIACMAVASHAMDVFPPKLAIDIREESEWARFLEGRKRLPSTQKRYPYMQSACWSNDRLQPVAGSLLPRPTRFVPLHWARLVSGSYPDDHVIITAPDSTFRLMLLRTLPESRRVYTLLPPPPHDRSDAQANSDVLHPSPGQKRSAPVELRERIDVAHEAKRTRRESDNAMSVDEDVPKFLTPPPPPPVPSQSLPSKKPTRRIRQPKKSLVQERGMSKAEVATWIEHAKTVDGIFAKAKSPSRNLTHGREWLTKRWQPWNRLPSPLRASVEFGDEGEHRHRGDLAVKFAVRRGMEVSELEGFRGLATRCATVPQSELDASFTERNLKEEGLELGVTIPEGMSRYVKTLELESRRLGEFHEVVSEHEWIERLRTSAFKLGVKR